MPKQPDKKQPDKGKERDSVAREVDRLLKQLPGADPTLQSDPDQPPPRPQPLQASGPRPAVPPLRPPRPTGPTPMQVWGVWGRLAGAGVLGVALTQWPYRSECGWSLYGYLAAVAALLLAAGWTAITAWRFRVAAAHAFALVAAFWGIVLAAEQILPRVGYAADVQVWRCSAVPAARVDLPLRPTAPVPVSDSTALADSVGGDSVAPNSGATIPQDSGAVRP
ncbi:MAG: hypothetical protein OEY20_07975 [Gemmatimonadota bacterium]|nr:hypothetical protein [Gemmatimonadota bacterium]MDH4349668.1 hypothetical protein [Gemmatimonadota bacterium]MDH5197172.1 hypothetical protein [Gemmatimonadota bacterium]